MKKTNAIRLLESKNIEHEVLGMKKKYHTVIDETASIQEKIIFSGGAVGIQIMLKPNCLLKIVNGEYADLT